MKRLRNARLDYINLFMELRSNQTEEVPVINTKVLSLPSTESGLAIFKSLESSTPELVDKRLIQDVRNYKAKMDVALRRYLDTFKKQISLIKESLTPLTAAHDMFLALYGKETYENIFNTTKVQYFANIKPLKRSETDGSENYHIVQVLAHLVRDMNMDNLAIFAPEHLHCTYFPEYGLTKPDYKSLVQIKPRDLKTFPELGYSTEVFHNLLDSLVNTGEHIKTFWDLKSVAEKIHYLFVEIDNSLTELSTAKKPGTYYKVTKAVARLNTCGVGVESLLSYLQTVAMNVYDSVYKLHIAEVDYNKTQF